MSEPKRFKNHEVKNMIYDLLIMSNEVDQNGQRLPFKSINKKHFKGIQGAKKKILAQILLGVIEKPVVIEEEKLNELDKKADEILSSKENQIIPIDFVDVYKKLRDKIKINFEESKIEWINQPDYKPDHKKSLIREKHTLDSEIELNTRELEAIKFLYNQRDDEDDLVDISVESFEEFEKLIEDVK